MGDQTIDIGGDHVSVTDIISVVDLPLNEIKTMNRSMQGRTCDGINELGWHHGNPVATVSYSARGETMQAKLCISCTKFCRGNTSE